MGGEKNGVCKDMEQVKASMVFAFPDAYELGMSHLGMRLIYETVNRQQDFLCERSFLPLDDMAAEMRSRNLPLFTWESKRPVRNFDVLGFTLQYELSYTNILRMLDLAGLPLTAAARRDWPVVIAGGPCAFNPEPLSDVIDLFVIGDGEEITLALLNLVAEVKAAGGGKEEFLRRALTLPGCYQPAHYRPRYDENGAFVALEGDGQAPLPVTKLVVADIDQAPFPAAPLIAQPKAVHDRSMLEIMRGCARGCRFCQAGILYRPVREKQVDTLLRQAAQQCAAGGYEDISLLSLSSADYSQIEPLMDLLLTAHAPQGCGISLPSLRVDAFSVDLAAKTAQVRKSGLTLAPEAGSQRLRDIINKGVTEDDLYSAAEAAFSQGYTGVKLYFMIGLPFETREDLLAIVDMCKKLLQIAKEHKPAAMNKPVRITLGVSNFVPKAHTPFQYCPQDTQAQLREKQEFLLEHIRPLRQVSVHYHDPRASLLEAAFARGDRRLAPVLRSAYALGCYMDGWSERFHFDLWQQAFAQHGLTIEQFAYQQYQPGQPLPWAHIDCGVDPQWFAREYAKAAAGITTEDCRRGGCNGCGVCDKLSVQNILAKPIAETSAPSASPLPRQNKNRRWRCRLLLGGPLIWQSHLEVLAAWEKALRRCNIPVAYSQGFNPHMQISWGPAHPVGVAGQSEYCDLYLWQAPETDWLQRLNETLPPGMQVDEAWEISLNEPALTVWLNRADYQMELPVGISREALLPAIEQLIRSASQIVERVGPKGRKEVDIRPAIIRLSATEDHLYYTLALDGGALAKPQELAACLLPSWQPAAVIRRLYHEE